MSSEPSTSREFGAETPSERVASLRRLFSAKDASVAHLLCDRHDPKAVAYTLIGSELGARDISYGTLRQASESLASGFWALGIRPGDRVATLMGKGRDYLVTVMAIWRMGAVHVPLFTAFGTTAVALRLASSAAKLVVCDEGQHGKLMSARPEPIPWRVVTTGIPENGWLRFGALCDSGNHRFDAVAVGGSGPIIQLYTSGTTGAPKAVAVPLCAIGGFQVYAEYGLGLQAGDVFWNAADPGWAYGLYYGVVAPLALGVRSLIVEGGFSPERTMEVLARFGVTVFAGAPTVYRSLRASGLKPRSALRLRSASSAGEPLTAEVNDWAQSALQVVVHDHYGQTETGMVVNNHQHPALRKEIKRGSMGQAMPGWSVAILMHSADEIAPTGEWGRIAINIPESPLAWFEGYVDDLERTAEKFVGGGRWYLTGDTGYVDSDGCFFFEGRSDDVIIMAGYRIGPLEVESALSSHPAVAECAAIAVPDEIRGEVLEAAVVLRPNQLGTDELTRELQAWVKTRYAAHAYPRRVHYLDKLPRTPSGKVQRFAIRQQLSANR